VEAKERKTLHNAIVDLKGAIRVFCRVRPMAPGLHDSPAVACKSHENSVTVHSGRCGPPNPTHPPHPPLSFL